MTKNKHIFIFGLGYVGLHLATRLSQHGWQITGTTRQPDRLDAQVPKSWTILEFSDSQAIDGLSDYLAPATHLISTISDLSGRDPVLAQHRAEIASFTGWTGYVSATSVYPDQPEGWVDEDTPARPCDSPRQSPAESRTRLAAGSTGRAVQAGLVYAGPGRNVLADVIAGTARIIDKPDQIFNRIHQSDISQIIMAAMDQPRANRIINLADQMPSAQGDVVRYAAQLVESAQEPVPLDKAGLSEMGRSFYTSTRRIRSKVIERGSWG